MVCSYSPLVIEEVRSECLVTILGLVFLIHHRRTKFSLISNKPHNRLFCFVCPQSFNSNLCHPSMCKSELKFVPGWSSITKRHHLSCLARLGGKDTKHCVNNVNTSFVYLVCLVARKKSKKYFHI